MKILQGALPLTLLIYIQECTAHAISSSTNTRISHTRTLNHTRLRTTSTTSTGALSYADLFNGHLSNSHSISHTTSSASTKLPSHYDEHDGLTPSISDTARWKGSSSTPITSANATHASAPVYGVARESRSSSTSILSSHTGVPHSRDALQGSRTTSVKDSSYNGSLPTTTNDGKHGAFDVHSTQSHGHHNASSASPTHYYHPYDQPGHQPQTITAALRPSYPNDHHHAAHHSKNSTATHRTDKYEHSAPHGRNNTATHRPPVNSAHLRHHAHSSTSSTMTNATGHGPCAAQNAKYITYSSLPVALPGQPQFVQKCNAALLQWHSSSAAWWSVMASRVTQPAPPPETRWTTRLLGTVPGALIGADGFTRAPMGANTDDFVVTSTQSVWKVHYPEGGVNTHYRRECFPAEQQKQPLTTKFPNPIPYCIIKHSDCQTLRDEARTSHLPNPVCGKAAYIYDRCHIFARKVDVYYWPDASVDASSQEHIGGNNVTNAPTQRGPRTVKVGDMVFTSPSIYLRLFDVGVKRTHFVEETSTVTSEQVSYKYIMSLPPNLLSSVAYSMVGCDGLCTGQLSSIFNTFLPASDAGTILTNVVQPYNPATLDMAAAPSASAYFWGRVNAGANLGRVPLSEMYYHPAQQIIYNNYIPEIAVPDQIRQLNETWSTCGLGIGGIYDLPIALTPEANLVVPTIVHPQPTATPPAPGSVGGSGIATMTSAPHVTKAPAPVYSSPSGGSDEEPNSSHTGEVDSSSSSGSASSGNNSPVVGSEPHGHSQQGTETPHDNLSPSSSGGSSQPKPFFAASPPTHNNVPAVGQGSTAPHESSADESAASATHENIGEGASSSTNLMGEALGALGGGSQHSSSSNVDTDSHAPLDAAGNSDQGNQSGPSFSASKTVLKDANGVGTATAAIVQGQTAVAGGAGVKMTDGSIISLSSDGRHVVMSPASSQGSAGDSSSDSSPGGSTDSTSDSSKQGSYSDSRTYSIAANGALIPASSSGTSDSQSDNTDSPAAQNGPIRTAAIKLGISQTLHISEAMIQPQLTGSKPDEAGNGQGQTQNQAPQAAAMISGHMLIPAGAAYTVPARNRAPNGEESHTISLAANGNIIVDGTSTLPLFAAQSTQSITPPQPPRDASPSGIVLSIAPHATLTAHPTLITDASGHVHTDLALADSTINIGGTIKTMGKTITAQENGLVEGGRTVAFSYPTATPNSLASNPTAVISLAPHRTVTAIERVVIGPDDKRTTDVVLGDKTLTAGAVVTTAGVTIKALANGEGVDVDGHSIVSFTAPTETADLPLRPHETVHAALITLAPLHPDARPRTEVVIRGRRLAAGQVFTLDGVVVTARSDGVVVGGRTVAFSATSTATVSATALGGENGGGRNGTAVPLPLFTGAGGRVGVGCTAMWLGMGVVAWVVW